MALLNKKETQSYVVLGLNRYVGQNGARCYAIAVDQYEEQTRDQAGCFGLSVALPYEEADKVISQKPGLFSPLVVECEGQTRSMGRNSAFVVERILSVSPLKKPSAGGSASSSASAT